VVIIYFICKTLIGFLKDDPRLLTAFIFLFPKTLADSSDEELCRGPEA